MSFLTIWIIFGLFLLVFEMLTGTFVLVFISLGCFFAALTAALLPDSFSAQALVCAGIAAIGTFLLRQPLQRKLMKSIHLQADIGREIQIDQDLPPHQQSRISYQGTTWSATNLGSENIRQGDKVTIVGMDGNMLLIRKIN